MSKNNLKKRGWSKHVFYFRKHFCRKPLNVKTFMKHIWIADKNSPGRTLPRAVRSAGARRASAAASTALTRGRRRRSGPRWRRRSGVRWRGGRRSSRSRRGTPPGRGWRPAWGEKKKNDCIKLSWKARRRQETPIHDKKYCIWFLLFFHTSFQFPFCCSKWHLRGIGSIFQNVWWRWQICFIRLIIVIEDVKIDWLSLQKLKFFLSSNLFLRERKVLKLSRPIFTQSNGVQNAIPGLNFVGFHL